MAKETSILIVVSDPHLATCCYDLLGALTYDRVTAFTLAEANHKLENHRGFDIAVVDMNLADGLGFSLLPALKARGIQILLLINADAAYIYSSTFSQWQQIDCGVFNDTLGATVLIKPIDYRQYVLTLEKLRQRKEDNINVVQEK